MKAKVIILGMCGTLLVSSCGTVGSGAATGSYLGGMFGSAIGGLSGGWRGHHVGTVIGMATGAVVGAAAGAAEEQKRERTIQEYHNRVAARQSYRQNQYQQNYGNQYDDSGYDASNSGDDRLYDFNPSGNASSSSSYSPSQSSTYTPSQSSNYSPSHNGGNGISASALADRYAIDIRNVHFVGEGAGNTLRRGESAKIIFEIKNVSGHMLYDIVPNVMETTNNRRIIISPSMRIESIAPGQTLRYTAMVRATQSLKAGEAHFVVTVSQGNKTASGVKDIVVYTSKR